MKNQIWKYCMAVIVLFMSANLFAQDYQINFGIEGSDEFPETIVVENLDQGTDLTLNGSDVLELVSEYVGINQFSNQNKNLRTYPNPMIEQTIVEYFNEESGYVSISVIDMFGRTIISERETFERGLIKYQLTGLGTGIYVVSLNSESSFNASIETKIVSHSNLELAPKLEFISFNEGHRNLSLLKSSSSIIQMQYNDGETLRFTTSNNCAESVIEMIVTESQTIDFNFVVTDIEGNEYRIVEIGGQCWMAENLRSISYNDGTAIELITDDAQWVSTSEGAYCWLNNDKNYAMSNNFGALYNWYTVETGNLCPDGWKVPAIADFEQLKNFIIDDGYPAHGQALKSEELWTDMWGNPAPGDDIYGFTALPAGDRFYENGSFSGINYFTGYWSSEIYVPQVPIIYWWGLITSMDTFEQGGQYPYQGYSVRCIKE